MTNLSANENIKVNSLYEKQMKWHVWQEMNDCNHTINTGELN